MLVMILQFIVLMAIVAGGLIFAFHRFLISSTDGAVNRLSAETEGARAKQAELNQKIKEADEELVKRKAEADELVKKMTEEADETAKKEKADILKKARKEAEEIITKAHRTKDAIREEIEKQLRLKITNECIKIVGMVFSEKARQVFSEQLVEEFIEKLKEVDAKQVNLDADTVEIVFSHEISDEIKKKIENVLLDKFESKVEFKYIIDSKIFGGAILKFGSLALDGSLDNILKETSTDLKREIEKG